MASILDEIQCSICRALLLLEVVLTDARVHCAFAEYMSRILNAPRQPYAEGWLLRCESLFKPPYAVLETSLTVQRSTIEWYGAPVRPNFFEKRTMQYALGTWTDTCIRLLRPLSRTQSLSSGTDPLQAARAWRVRSDLHLSALLLLFNRHEWADETARYVRKLVILEKSKSRRLASGYAPLLHS